MNSEIKTSWWEDHPMTYDRKERLDDERLGLEYFKEVDRRMREGHWFAQKPSQPLFSNLIPYPSLRGKKVLEIGCGLGSIAQELARQGARLTVVDLTRRALQLTSRRFGLQGLQGSFVRANAEKLPFRNDSFDYVWSWGVLHHTPGTEQTIEEIRRVLKPRGRLAVMLYNRHSIRNLVRIVLLRGIFQLKFLTRSLEQLENQHSDGDIAKHFTPGNMKKLFERFDGVRLSVFGQRSEIFPGYDRLPAFITLPFEGVVRSLLRKFGWFLFLEAQKPQANA